ncbi:MAG: site-specific integrase, partial [Cyanothece sp. SIO1E1]|nr:site-specific integrase [Cyanothece sp. SIO1E1]
KKLPKKQRRNFTHQEAKVVIQQIRKEEPLLFIALLLEYCCFARPTEIRHLRFMDINIENGLVFIDRKSGKTKEDRSLTIPNVFLQYFPAVFFESFPKSYFIFGSGFHPHPNKPCGVNTMGNKHRAILRKLKDKGKLKDITGLQWYSWKDTGITDALEDLPLLAVQDQAGHSTPEMTLRYRHKKLINRQIKEGFKNKVI